MARSSRATVIAETFRAPAESRAAAQVASVVPVTTTSSTRTTDRPGIREACVNANAGLVRVSADGVSNQGLAHRQAESPAGDLGERLGVVVAEFANSVSCGADRSAGDRAGQGAADHLVAVVRRARYLALLDDWGGALFDDGPALDDLLVGHAGSAVPFGANPRPRMPCADHRRPPASRSRTTCHAPRHAPSRGGRLRQG